MKLGIFAVTTHVTPEWHSDFNGKSGGGDPVNQYFAVDQSDGSVWRCYEGGRAWLEVKLPDSDKRVKEGE